MKDYVSWWEEWYGTGGTSGPGSYGVLAEFKADVVNRFIAANDVQTVWLFVSMFSITSPMTMITLKQCPIS